LAMLVVKRRAVDAAVWIRVPAMRRAARPTGPAATGAAEAQAADAAALMEIESHLHLL